MMKCRLVVFGLTWISAAFVAGCGDGEKRRPLGESCGEDGECASGFCYASQCLDPEGDADNDTLTNRLEATLGTDPFDADSDGDGTPDGAEVEAGAHKDSDGDGKADALESATADADGDCLPDQDDPDDTTDTSNAVAELCGEDGVCATGAAVVCDGTSLVCDRSGIEGFAETDACDGLDNDCDGVVDEDAGWGECYPVDCRQDRWDNPEPVDGLVTLDPSGGGGSGPMEVECLHSFADGGWARMTEAFRAEMHETAAYEYLFRSGDDWVMTAATVRWSWESPAWAPVTERTWVSGAPGRAWEAFRCEEGGDASGIQGLGCLGPAGGKSIFIPASATVDRDAGTVTLCVADPASYNVAEDCLEGVAVYVRRVDCAPDAGSTIANGDFSAPDDWRFCWYRGQPEGFDAFAPGESSVTAEDAPSLFIAGSPGRDVHEVRIQSVTHQLLAEHAYQVTFDIWTSAPKLIEVGVYSWREEVDFVLQALRVSGGWHQVELGLKPAASGLLHEVLFYFGGAGDALLDNVRWKDLGPIDCIAEGPNLVSNGTFDTSTACWRVLFTNPAMHAVPFIDRSGEDPAFAITLGTDGQDETLVSLVHPSLPLEAGRTYRLAFDVSSADGPRSGAIQLFRPDYQRAFHYARWNTTEPFETIFTMPVEGVDALTLLEIKLGANPAGTLRIDDVVLEVFEIEPQ